MFKGAFFLVLAFFFGLFAFVLGMIANVRINRIKPVVNNYQIVATATPAPTLIATATPSAMMGKSTGVVKKIVVSPTGTLTPTVTK